MMKYTNVTNIKDFIIIGFPGLLPEYYVTVSIVLLLVFLAIVVGNAFVLTVIISERTLHKPTYMIFLYLAIGDFLFGTVTLPKIIARYWWNDVTISFGACFTQMYFVHSLGASQSAILFIMSLDRFVAILFPYRYPVLFTNKVATIFCGLCWALTFIRMMGLVLHALTLPYCDQNVITQCYCDHNSITKLGCGDDVKYVKYVALANSMFSLMVPLSFIILSYFSIIVAALKISQTGKRYKLLSTCTPQIFITCLYYVPRCFVYLSDNLGFKYSVDGRIILAMTYSLIPSAVNPMIYCFQTKDIKEALLQRYRKQRINIAIK
ncbi:olfactory receptor 52Z1-like [Melanotaenia boesemani]|uniref:olfactory receptor 52Z1-like n=1 Tax=Melanotaenia boesemani TaxID=1250792 RepID=UPI001C04C2F7|nr:olfactory receptor 52Z1-like [Melanotaenia boesemani]